MSARKVYQHTPSGQKSTPKFNHSPKKPKPKRGRNILIGLGLAGISLISAVAGALLALTFSVSSPLQQAELTPEEKAIFSHEEPVAQNNLTIPELSRPVNILVLGIKVLTSDLEKQPQEDLGYHALVNSFEGLSDTMLLLRFDPAKEKVTVLSIPRDTQVEIDGYGIQKINIANEYGGPALTAESTSKLLGGVNIDRYVRVNVQGIEKLIDALGGVNVYVPKDMKYNDFSQHLYIDLKKGQQVLDGNKAVQFLRFRYDAYGDISRVQRQQMLMRAVIEQTLKPSTIVKIPKILSVIQSHLDTNLTVKELMALASFASKTERSDVQMMMLPGDFSSDGRTEISYWLPDYDRIEKLVAQHFQVTAQSYDSTNGDRFYANKINKDNENNLNQRDIDSTYQDGDRVFTDNDQSNLRIAIQDSLDDPEAVQIMLNRLQEAGYNRIFVSSDSSEPLTVTKVVAQGGDNRAAAILRANLGIGEVLVESTGVLGSDLTIQIGKDWQKYLQSNTSNSSQENGKIRDF